VWGRRGRKLKIEINVINPIFPEGSNVSLFLLAVVWGPRAFHT